MAGAETLTEIFDYVITDGDGDTSTTTLTITINGTNDGVTITGLEAASDETVYEEDLPDGADRTYENGAAILIAPESSAA